MVSQSLSSNSWKSIPSGNGEKIPELSGTLIPWDPTSRVLPIYQVGTPDKFPLTGFFSPVLLVRTTKSAIIQEKVEKLVPFRGAPFWGE